LIEALAQKGIIASVKSQRKVKELVDLTNEVLSQNRKRVLPQAEDPLLLGLTSPKPLIGSKKLLDSGYCTQVSSVIGRGRPPVDYQTV
jgi:hypothetical protein